MDTTTHILENVVRCKYFEACVHVKNPIKNSYQDGSGRTTQTLDHVVVVHILFWDKRKSQINEYSDSLCWGSLIVESEGQKYLALMRKSDKKKILPLKTSLCILGQVCCFIRLDASSLHLRYFEAEPNGGDGNNEGSLSLSLSLPKSPIPSNKWGEELTISYR